MEDSTNTGRLMVVVQADGVVERDSKWSDHSLLMKALTGPDPK